MASLAALVGVELVLCLPAAARAETVAPLPESNYSVQPACRAAEPGHAGCLALALAPRTAAARAHRHPIGITRRQALRGASAAEGSYGLRPEDLQDAYFHGLLPQAPETEPQTIALVDAYNDYEAETDLKKYDQEFGLGELALCSAGQTSDCFEQVNQRGESGSLPFPRSASELLATEEACVSSKTESKTRERDCEQALEADGWAVEISTDIEVARGVCQNCRIVLVEAGSSAYAALEEAEQTAVRLGATEVSNSWGGREPQFDSAAFDHPGVVIAASAGDDGYLNWTEAAQEGYYSGADYPASSPHVVAVGGTKLTIANGARASETVWNEDPDPAGGDEGAAGGGCSASFSAPIWQSSVPDWSQVGCGSKRAVSDVAADADPYTGVAVYDTMPYLRTEVNAKGEERVSKTPLKWVPIGGTSVASPIIASIFALAGGAHGVEYPAQTLYSHLGQSSLYDVASGGNGKCDGRYSSCSGSLSSALDCGEAWLICKAATGYDGPTGVGAPDGLGAFEPATSDGGGEEEVKEEAPKEEAPTTEKPPLKEEQTPKEQEGPQEELKLREALPETPVLGASGGPSSSPGASRSGNGGQAQILVLALTRGAAGKLRGHGALADEVAFRFKLSLSASVRVSLAHLLHGRARQTWRELAQDARAFAAAAGTSRAHLDARNRLGAGSYRLTLSTAGGGSRAIVFTVG